MLCICVQYICYVITIHNFYICNISTFTEVQVTVDENPEPKQAKVRRVCRAARCDAENPKLGGWFHGKSIWRFPEMVVSQNILFITDFPWGYPYFRKPPSIRWMIWGLLPWLWKPPFHLLVWSIYGTAEWWLWTNVRITGGALTCKAEHPFTKGTLGITHEKWRKPYGGFLEWGYPKNGWFIRESPFEHGWWLRVPPILGTPHVDDSTWKAQLWESRLLDPGRDVHSSGLPRTTSGMILLSHVLREIHLSHWGLKITNQSATRVGTLSLIYIHQIEPTVC